MEQLIKDGTVAREKWAELVETVTGQGATYACSTHDLYPSVNTHGITLSPGIGMINGVMVENTGTIAAERVAGKKYWIDSSDLGSIKTSGLEEDLPATAMLLGVNYPDGAWDHAQLVWAGAWLSSPATKEETLQHYPSGGDYLIHAPELKAFYQHTDSGTVISAASERKTETISSFPTLRIRNHVTREVAPLDASTISKVWRDTGTRFAYSPAAGKRIITFRISGHVAWPLSDTVAEVGLPFGCSRPLRPHPVSIIVTPEYWPEKKFIMQGTLMPSGYVMWTGLDGQENNAFYTTEWKSHGLGYGKFHVECSGSYLTEFS